MKRLCLALVLALALAAVLPVAEPVWAGDDAGPGAVPVLDLEQYRGRVVYLDFWASWCRPCRASFPWMDQMVERYGHDGLVVIAVNVDRDRDQAERFLEELSPSFAVVFDPTAALARRYHLDTMPSSFLYDRGGNLVSSHAGFRDRDRHRLEEEIGQLLAGTAVGGTK